MYTPGSATDTRNARQEAVAAGVARVRLEGFTTPGALALINGRFVRGDISAADRLAQARALCEKLAQEANVSICA